MENTDKNAGTIIVACISAVATLGAALGTAYISKLDFNPHHAGIEQEIQEKDRKIRVLTQNIKSQTSEKSAEPTTDSCGPLLTRYATDANGRAYNIELTMHRENAKWVSYSAGSLKA